jgi:hypothetical protein
MKDKLKVNFVCPSCGGTRIKEIRQATVVSFITGAHDTEFEYKPIMDRDVAWDSSEWLSTECAQCGYRLRGTDEDVIKWLKERNMLEKDDVPPVCASQEIL